MSVSVSAATRVSVVAPGGAFSPESVHESTLADSISLTIMPIGMVLPWTAMLWCAPIRMFVTGAPAGAAAPCSASSTGPRPAGVMLVESSVHVCAMPRLLGYSSRTNGVRPSYRDPSDPDTM